MAQRTVVVMVDDRTGEQGPPEHFETVHFMDTRGQWWEIDLAKPNADTMRAALSQYTAVARVKASREPESAGKGKRRTARDPNQPTRAQIAAEKRKQLDAVRAWVREQGEKQRAENPDRIDYWKVSTHGRIPIEYVQAYQRAQLEKRDREQRDAARTGDDAPPTPVASETPPPFIASPFSPPSVS